MTDDDRYDNLTGGTHSVIKIIIFSLIAIIIINSFVLPVIASIGERTETTLNDGVRVSSINLASWTEMTSGYGPAAPYLMMSDQGIAIRGYVDGVLTNRYLVHAEDYQDAYPIMILRVGTTQQDIYSYDSSRSWYVSTSAINGVVDIGPNLQLNPISSLSDDAEIWYQDPKGDKVMTRDPLVFSNDNERIFGLKVEYGVSLYATMDDAILLTNENGTSRGPPTVDATEHDGYTELRDISYGGYDCEYYFGPLVGYVRTYNILDGTAVGSLINTIPMLMIVGLVIYVVRAIRNDDI